LTTGGKMTINRKVLLLNLPSPKNQILWRDTAGGFGTSVYAPPNLKTSNSTPLHPFLPYASAILSEAGVEFEVLDCQRLNIDNQQTISKVESLSPDLIFSIISLPSMSNDLSILKAISGRLQNVITVGVGTVCHVLPDEILLKKKIDLLLRNSYPYINGLLDLVFNLQKSALPENVNGISYVKGNQVFNTPDLSEFDFEKLPSPNYNHIPLDGYDTYSDKIGRRYPYVLIVDSKGCPYGCAYCAYPLGYGKRFTFRSPTKIVDEIEYLHNTRGINIFAFKGQSFAYNKTHAKKVCDEITTRKLKINWFCESRVDEVNQDYLQKMKAAGCERIHFGVETGDPEILKTAKVGVTLDRTKIAFELTKSQGILTQAHIVLGWPQDTKKTLDNTRKFLIKINPDALNVNFLTPYPGTAIYDLAKKESLLLTSDWSKFTSHSVVMKTRTLNTQQLYNAKSRIIRDFSLLKLENLVLDSRIKSLNDVKALAGKARVLTSKALFSKLD
jgi:anaerobic magnesium-protoporphyrin IX monomethyl ester cyclase